MYDIYSYFVNTKKKFINSYDDLKNHQLKQKILGQRLDTFLNLIKSNQHLKMIFRKDLKTIKNDTCFDQN